MSRIKAILFLFLFFMLTYPGNSQELNCRVNVNADRVQTTERNIFSEMEVVFAQFMTENKWTDKAYQPFERINCMINISIENMPSIGVFTASVQIQSSRPVYDTNYETILLNFADRDWQFQYTESMRLDFVENTFTTNLASMLSFYAYVILGLDYNSFNKLGGTEYFSKALNIANLAQGSGMPGWQPFESNRNRYWLIENLTSTEMLGIREGYYTYHRLGIDNFTVNPEEARVSILGVLKELETVKDLYTNSILVISFFDAKSDEITQIYSEGNIQVRREAYNILTKIDPTKTEKYKIIVQN